MHWPTTLVSTLALATRLAQGGYTEEQVYPSPNATGSGGWYAAYQRAVAATATLNLTEKAFLVTGVEGPCVGNIPALPKIGFKGLCLQDGPLAIREVSYASVFPAGVSVAATWDQDLFYQRGVALGSEFRGKGANVALGYVFHALL